MKLKLFVLLGSISLIFAGCAVTKYHWGNYENSLYNYYKNPSEVEQLGENLSKIITDAEANGQVPPGVYAEYGYVLHILGKSQEAVIFFEKERKAWPESQILMDKMINLINGEVLKNSTQNLKQLTN